MSTFVIENKKPNEKILIVDDDHHIAKVASIYLEQFGYIVVDIANCGNEGIIKAKTFEPDLVLMDIHLGDNGLDGIEAAEVIMEKLSIPVVYITAFNDPETLERARLTSPYGYINKPIRDTDLKTTIRFALDTSHRKPEQDTIPELHEVLEQVYDLSPAESRILSSFMENPDVEDIAKLTHLSVSTVRTHLKHIYRKTGTKRQSALFHEIITGPVAMIMRPQQSQKKAGSKSK